MHIHIEIVADNNTNSALNVCSRDFKLLVDFKNPAIEIRQSYKVCYCFGSVFCFRSFSFEVVVKYYSFTATRKIKVNDFSATLIRTQHLSPINLKFIKR